MMKIVKSSYFLGMILGVCICVLLMITYSFFVEDIFLYKNKKAVETNANTINKESELIIENEKLKSEIQTLRAEKDKVTTGSQVNIDILQSMTNSDIADLIVENNIYTNKKDIMFIIELLRIDGWLYTVKLEDIGVMRFGGDFLLNIDSVYNNRGFSAEELQKAGYVQDTQMFEKIVSFFRYNDGIKYGTKTFYTGMSLVDIADTLIN